MKKVEAVIKPFTLEEIQEALTALGVDGMTVSEVKGLDHDTHSAFYRGTRYDIAFAPVLKREVVVPDELVAGCVAVIQRLAAAGGDSGAIVVLAVEDLIRIRTGEHLARAA